MEEAILLCVLKSTAVSDPRPPLHSWGSWSPDFCFLAYKQALILHKILPHAQRLTSFPDLRKTYGSSVPHWVHPFLHPNVSSGAALSQAVLDPGWDPAGVTAGRSWGSAGATPLPAASGSALLVQWGSWAGTPEPVLQGRAAGGPRMCRPSQSCCSHEWDDALITRGNPPC